MHWRTARFAGIVVGLLGVVAIAAYADAAVLCANPSGSVFLRDACKGKETQLDPVALGLVGPRGPQGPTGPQGPAGPAGPPAQLTCPADTTLFTGVCIENTARTPADHSTATRTCAAVGRRLPSGGELQGFRDIPGITLTTNGEWTDDLGDITAKPSFVYLAVTDNGNGVLEANVPTAYRCVAGPVTE